MLRVYTIASRNYLPAVRVLMLSVARFLPAASRTVFLTDAAGGNAVWSQEDFEVLDARTTSLLPRFRHRAFAFNASELCFVLKPFCAQILLARNDCDTLLYFDSDTQLFAEPRELLAMIANHPLVLTPHLLDATRNVHSALPTMRSGAFNGGMFAVSSHPLARQFLTWWGNQLAEPANIAADWAHDQGWLNLVPALFPEFGLLRHPGYNVAFWNLHERDVAATTAGTLRAGDSALVLFHFSFFDPVKPDRLTGSLRTNFSAPNEAVHSIMANYATLLRKHGYDEARRLPYGYGSFSDGHPITQAHRRYFAERMFAILPDSADPFDTTLRLPGYTGLKSLYHADHRLVRIARAFKTALRSLET